MNPAFVDPDVKINMSLDEIIQLSRGQIEAQMPGRRMRKKKRHSKRNVGNNDHSVPLLSSANGVGIYVSKKSCLLSAEHQNWIRQAVSNRAMNCDLLKKSKVVIPAEYKLFRTDEGVQRILVPTEGYFSKCSREKLVPPRKLNKSEEKPDKPPPLVTAPIYQQPPSKVEKDMNMDVDGSEDDIFILDPPCHKKELTVIDVECNLPVDVLEAKKLCVPDTNLRHPSQVKTLSERFTMLTGSFQF